MSSGDGLAGQVRALAAAAQIPLVWFALHDGVPTLENEVSAPDYERVPVSVADFESGAWRRESMFFAVPLGSEFIRRWLAAWTAAKGGKRIFVNLLHQPPEAKEMPGAGAVEIRGRPSKSVGGR